MNEQTEPGVGGLLLLGLIAGASLALALREAIYYRDQYEERAGTLRPVPRRVLRRVARAAASSRFEAVLAAMLAYGCYVAAALLAKAEFPRFLRDHLFDLFDLFDGLVPAALVGVVVDRFPRKDALKRSRESDDRLRSCFFYF